MVTKIWARKINVSCICAACLTFHPPLQQSRSADTGVQWAVLSLSGTISGLIRIERAGILNKPVEEVKESAESDEEPKPKKTKKADQPTKKKKKQVKECILSKPEEKEETAKKSRKRKKKTITDVLAASAPKPGTPEDLQNLIEQYYGKTRSVIEMEELKLPDNCFAKENDLSHTLSSYLKEVCPKWSKLSKNHKEKKSIVLLVVCSSAHRTLELIKLINAFRGDTKIMKLFAKHIKIKDQIKWLEDHVVHLGVGTPGRIKSLIEQDGLTLQSLKYLVLDWNWRDQKLRRMADIPEVKKEMLELLVSGPIAACREGSLKIGLF
ncbi:protein CMSS1 isoform X2 [Hyla sarda]|uniref:protein CMSS1 isoform X2 n=1 Tax=Hyla sarda TaxID=327740 RepID=UPI0024C2286D|nr:protein CMSS1 isoform X2 [Hyla sarda]